MNIGHLRAGLFFALLFFPWRPADAQVIAARPAATVKLVVPANVTAENDEFVSTLKWSATGNATGYDVRWGVAGTLDKSTRTPYLQAQCQPLSAGVPYQAQVRSLYPGGASPNGWLSTPGYFEGHNQIGQYYEIPFLVGN